ncbi:MAG: hypothetical protein WDZ89_04955 [Gemmatimonadota bacterium]
MHDIQPANDIKATYLPRSRGLTFLFGGLFLVGLLAFVVTLVQDPDRAWRAYVVNWLYFTSIAMGAVMLSVVTTITSAKWNWSVRRASLAFSAFLPLSFLLFLPMLTLRERYFPWIEAMEWDPIVQAKSAYLNIPFLVTRNVLGLALLFSLALYFAYLALRPDMGLTEPGDEDEARKGWRERFTQGWLGQEAEEVHSWSRMKRVGPAIALAYAVVMSVVIFDFAMSLEPHWFSTLFGGWFFMGAFWGGIAATALVSVWLKGRRDDWNAYIGVQQLHDLGKLTFAFTVFWAYLFWSQYIVIWYGKLPWEQAWVIRRSTEPWTWLSILVLMLCFIVPFVGLLGKKPKTTPRVLGFFALVVLVGLWFERYLLVVPSIHHEGAVISVWEPLIGLMFLGLFLGAVRWFLTSFPVIQIWQAPADPEALEMELRGDELQAGVRHAGGAARTR